MQKDRACNLHVSAEAPSLFFRFCVALELIQNRLQGICGQAHTAKLVVLGGCNTTVKTTKDHEYLQQTAV